MPVALRTVAPSAGTGRGGQAPEAEHVSGERPMHLPGRFVVHACAILGLVVSLAAPAANAAPVAEQAATMPVADPAGADWMTYGGNLYNQRYSSLNQINAS